MNSPYDQNLNNNTEPKIEDAPAKEEPTPQHDETNAEQAQNNSQNSSEEYSGQYRQYNRNTYNQQYTPPYGEYRQGTQYSQNNQYGYQRPQYSGYYGDSGYYGQQAPQAPTYSPYNRQQKKSSEKKTASKGFVIGMLAIALVISILANATICILLLPF